MPSATSPVLKIQWLPNRLSFCKQEQRRTSLNLRTWRRIHCSDETRCIRLDGPAARCSGRPKLRRQFVPVRNFQPRLFVPMPGNMGRPAFTFINLDIFCNLQRIINQNIHLDYVCIYFLIRKFVCLFVCLLASSLKSKMLVNGLIK
jgi:hypothetical protein